MEGYEFDDTCTPQSITGVIPACFAEVLGKALSNPQIDTLVFEDFTDWTYTFDFSGISTPLNGGHLVLSVFGGAVGEFVCKIEYPVTSAPLLVFFSGTFSTSYEYENYQYLEYLKNL